MTIDEAIKHAEKEAKEQDKLCKRYDDASGYSRSHNEAIRTTNAKKCEECAKEHRQLAEWLKDYKRLLEQEPVIEPLERLAESASKTAKVLERLKVSEQEPILDKIRAEIDELYSYVEFDEDIKTSFNMIRLEEVQRVIDKYKAESEEA